MDRSGEGQGRSVRIWQWIRESLGYGPFAAETIAWTLAN
jgi:hypothetical protein